MTEGYARSGDAELYFRSVGEGPPMVVVHGGPDFDHRYLLPDMDRLAADWRLVCHDQRCVGKSRGPLRLDEIHVDTYVADLDAVRRHLGLGRIAVLGHSWGAYVALQYALWHPESARLDLSWTREQILRGREIEARLDEGPLWQPGFDLRPALRGLHVPTLVIHGEDDFFAVESSRRIADALPEGRLHVIPESGHFSYIDAPGAIREILADAIH